MRELFKQCFVTKFAFIYVGSEMSACSSMSEHNNSSWCGAKQRKSINVQLPKKKVFELRIRPILSRSVLRNRCAAAH